MLARGSLPNRSAKHGAGGRHEAHRWLRLRKSISQDRLDRSRFFAGGSPTSDQMRLNDKKKRGALAVCGFCTSRRSFLGGIAAFGAAGFMAKTDFSQAQQKQTKPYRIDVHYHHVPPAWIADPDVAKGLSPIVIKTVSEWTPARAIEEMDRNNIETAITSVSNPGVWLGDGPQSRRLARICNEFGAQMGRDYPGRFGLFAALPLPDTEGSLAEIAYAFDTLKADGIGLFTSYGDKWFADPAFAPVFEELNRRKAVIFVHPYAANCCRNLIAGIPAAVIEYPVDTTRAIMQWIVTKGPTTYPDIKVIFAHAGGLMMAGVGRLTVLFETQPTLRDRMPADLRAELRKLYYEISSSSDAVTMSALRALVPSSHILLGTDAPYGPTPPTIDMLQTNNLSAAELYDIERKNAAALFKRF